MAQDESRAEKIIREIESGGFTYEELNEIIEACCEEQGNCED